MSADKNTKADPTEKNRDLAKELADKRTDLIEARKSNASGELANPKAINLMRKDIARLLTEINAQKEKN